MASVCLIVHLVPRDNELQVVAYVNEKQDPGKTFKGKKMPGHMGNKHCTVQNMKVCIVKGDELQLIKIDPKRNLLYVKGCVPGNDGEYVKVTDGRDVGPFELPFPT